ncbi:hypothetical protein C8R44DRAFT_867086 [Mycena epipterygia]|nr:hypothetical protein C8R44DRAFT_867086 [Mycena epipterygia]
MIPTPSPSRLIWGVPAAEDPGLAGPRYEEIRPLAPPPSGLAARQVSPQSTPARKTRRISKDMVSRPTGFVHLVHASDADQSEALLNRWGPDGMGELGDPHWANPTKDRVRQTNQAKAVNEVVNALKPSQDSKYDGRTQEPLCILLEKTFDLCPAGFPGHPGGYTTADFRFILKTKNTCWTLQSRLICLPLGNLQLRRSRLEKAVSARIYFENLYFPLFRHPPSREQYRLAMDRDTVEILLSQMHKENLRARWRQNETDYLRDKRRRNDVTPFRKLKTIGHGEIANFFNLHVLITPTVPPSQGAFGVVSLINSAGGAE